MKLCLLAGCQINKFPITSWHLEPPAQEGFQVVHFEGHEHTCKAYTANGSPLEYNASHWRFQEGLEVFGVTKRPVDCCGLIGGLPGCG